MPTLHLPRVVEDAALGLAVGFLSLTTIHLPDFDNRRDLRTGRGSDGPGDGGPGRGGGFPDTIDWLQFLATLGLVGALALRRTAPRVAYVGVLATMAMFLLAGGPYALVLLGPALAVHTLMTRYPPASSCCSCWPCRSPSPPASGPGPTPVWTTPASTSRWCSALPASCCPG